MSQARRWRKLLSIAKFNNYPGTVVRLACGIAAGQQDDPEVITGTSAYLGTSFAKWLTKVFFQVLSSQAGSLAWEEGKGELLTF